MTTSLPSQGDDSETSAPHDPGQAAPWLAPLLDAVRDCAQEAGEIAQRYFVPDGQTTARIWMKPGGSPVTEADISVDAFLKVRLSSLLPDAGWLSEETIDDSSRFAHDRVWVVDPIDGTRAFMSGSPDWAVCIGLIDAGRPVLGVVHAPECHALYEAIAHGPARRNGKIIAASSCDTLAQARIAGPKPMLEALHRLAPFEMAQRVPSLALRVARVADGSLDGGLVSPNARDWDIAAAAAILTAAGGRLTTLTGAAPPWNQPDPVHGSLVIAGAGLHDTLLAATNRLAGTMHARR